MLWGYRCRFILLRLHLRLHILSSHFSRVCRRCLQARFPSSFLCSPSFALLFILPSSPPLLLRFHNFFFSLDSSHSLRFKKPRVVLVAIHETTFVRERMLAYAWGRAECGWKSNRGSSAARTPPAAYVGAPISPFAHDGQPKLFLAEMPHTLSRYHRRCDEAARPGRLSYYLSRGRFERCAVADKPDSERFPSAWEEVRSTYRTLPGKSSVETLLWYRE